MRVTKSRSFPVLPVLVLVVSGLIALAWVLFLTRRAQKARNYIEMATRLEQMRMNGGNHHG